MSEKPCEHGWRVKLTPAIVAVTEQGVTYQQMCPECGHTWTELRDEKLAQIALFVVRKAASDREQTWKIGSSGQALILSDNGSYLFPRDNDESA